MITSTRPWVYGLCLVRTLLRPNDNAVLPLVNRAVRSLNERGLSVPLMLSVSYYAAGAYLTVRPNEDPYGRMILGLPPQSGTGIFYPITSSGSHRYT